MAEGAVRAEALTANRRGCPRTWKRLSEPHLVVDKIGGLFDAILDGFFIATNEVLNFALQIVK